MDFLRYGALRILRKRQQKHREDMQHMEGLAMPQE